MADHLSRRQFAGLSVAGAAAMALPRGALAAQACSSGQSFLPGALTIDCAAHKNFALFRQYSDAVGLAGLVCMKSARGVHGTYDSGTLVLYPWLKPAGQASKALTRLACAFPTGAAKSAAAATKPIPNAFLPQDEYVCRYIIQAPWQSFIGFMVDAPIRNANQTEGQTQIARLADGLGATLDWSSANLNQAWFDGGHVIPAGGACNGAAWRKLIVAGLNQAARSACS